MMNIETLSVVALADEFGIEYEDNGQIRRHYFPYDALTILTEKLQDLVKARHVESSDS